MLCWMVIVSLGDSGGEGVEREFNNRISVSRNQESQPKSGPTAGSALKSSRFATMGTLTKPIY